MYTSLCSNLTLIWIFLKKQSFDSRTIWRSFLNSASFFISFINGWSLCAADRFLSKCFRLLSISLGTIEPLSLRFPVFAGVEVCKLFHRAHYHFHPGCCQHVHCYYLLRHLNLQKTLDVRHQLSTKNSKWQRLNIPRTTPYGDQLLVMLKN